MCVIKKIYYGKEVRFCRYNQHRYGDQGTTLAERSGNICSLRRTGYSRLSNYARYICILQIEMGSVTEDRATCVNDEEVIYRLIESVPSSQRKDFLEKFEPIIFKIANKLDGDNYEKIIFLLSKYIQEVYGAGQSIATVGQYSFRSDGSAYNHIFLWDETMGPDPLYKLTLLSSSFQVDVRSDWSFSDHKPLMGLTAYEFIGIDAKVPIPGLTQATPDDIVIIPAISFYWLCKQRNKEEAWRRFFQGADVAATFVTLGTYGASKTALQLGTTFTMGMALDYTIRLGINSLGEDDFSEAVKNTSVLDAGWNAATTLISNQKMAMALNCVRYIVKNSVESKDITEGVSNCIKSIVLTMISNKLFTNTGGYASLLKEQFQKQPSKTIGKLKSYGVTQESLLDLTRTLFANTNLELVNRLEIIIKEKDE